MRIPFYDDPISAAEYVLAGGPADPADLIDLIDRLIGTIGMMEHDFAWELRERAAQDNNPAG